MVNVKKRKGRVVIDSDSEDSASDDNLDQVSRRGVSADVQIPESRARGVFRLRLGNISADVHASSNCAISF